MVSSLGTTGFEETVSSVVAGNSDNESVDSTVVSNDDVKIVGSAVSRACVAVVGSTSMGTTRANSVDLVSVILDKKAAVSTVGRAGDEGSVGSASVELVGIEWLDSSSIGPEEEIVGCTFEETPTAVLTSGICQSMRRQTF
jgi:hypothetical protein